MALVTKRLQVQLKRAYAPPSPEDGVRVLVDRLGHAACASQRCASTGGSRTWRLARSYADGSGMIRTGGSSSVGDTRLSSQIKLNSSASFERWHEPISSRSSLRLATSCITKPSSSETFLQIEHASLPGGLVWSHRLA